MMQGRANLAVIDGQERAATPNVQADLGIAGLVLLAQFMASQRMLNQLAPQFGRGDELFDETTLLKAGGTSG